MHVFEISHSALEAYFLMVNYLLTQEFSIGHEVQVAE